jgi:hypothetical protein
MELPIISLFIGIFGGAIIATSLIIINFKNFKKWVKRANSTFNCKMN